MDKGFCCCLAVFLLNVLDLMLVIRFCFVLFFHLRVYIQWAHSLFSGRSTFTGGSEWRRCCMFFEGMHIQWMSHLTCSFSYWYLIVSGSRFFSFHRMLTHERWRELKQGIEISALNEYMNESFQKVIQFSWYNSMAKALPLLCLQSTRVCLGQSLEYLREKEPPFKKYEINW